MDSVRNGIWNVIIRFLLAVISTLGVFIVFGLILDQLEILIYSRMASKVGRDIILVTGVVGTPLHEASHWLGCKIFGFKVLEVSLFRPLTYKFDGILGYVLFLYSNKGWWSKLGCFVVGMAPMIFGSLFMILIVWLVVPEVFKTTKHSIEASSKSKIPILPVWWAAFSGFWKGMFSLRKWGILRGIITLYLIISIAMHMTVSTQDIKAATPGFGIVALIYLLYSLITAIIGTEYKLAAMKRGAFIASFLSIGLLADGLHLLISLFF
ncbi:MAG: hypothetical protein J6113_09505 [Lachnospiraceae bacterium]|nr:hypothetical protein [Lachnospiraceae bacterium]